MLLNIMFSNKDVPLIKVHFILQSTLPIISGPRQPFRTHRTCNTPETTVLQNMHLSIYIQQMFAKQPITRELTAPIVL